jgi:hypothetical protein
VDHHRNGDPTLAAPRYDLEATRATIPATLAPAAWGLAPPIALASEPEGLAMPATGSAIDPTGFAYAREFPAGAAGLISIASDWCSPRGRGSSNGR